MFIGTIASGLSIANSLGVFGGGTSGSSASGANPVTPWWLSGGADEASTILKGYLGGPSSNMPGFDQFNKQSLDATSRKLSASGLHASGAEQSALNTQSQGNMLNYWTTMTGQLGSLAGLNFNPAAGVATANQQSNINQGNVAAGIGGIKQLFGGTQGTTSYGQSTSTYGDTTYYGAGAGPNTSWGYGD